MEANTEQVSNTEQEVLDKFHKIEKDCIGYENMVNNEDKFYIKTLNEVRQLVNDIQRMGLFSPNEEIKEIATENLKLIMAPYYQADTLFRIMDQRGERVKMAHVFYLEYLKLLNHYGVLEKSQQDKLKMYQKKHKVGYQMSRTDASPEELKEAQELMREIQMSRPNAYEDRDAKISEFKLKKLIEKQLDELRDYRDEEMKRDFYMM